MKMALSVDGAIMFRDYMRSTSLTNTFGWEARFRQMAADASPGALGFDDFPIRQIAVDAVGGNAPGAGDGCGVAFLLLDSGGVVAPVLGQGAEIVDVSVADAERAVPLGALLDSQGIPGGAEPTSHCPQDEVVDAIT
jgi:hypothetical protein